MAPISMTTRADRDHRTEADQGAGDSLRHPALERSAFRVVEPREGNDTALLVAGAGFVPLLSGSVPCPSGARSKRLEASRDQIGINKLRNLSIESQQSASIIISV